MDALFTIHSKRASPVEVGLEVTEDSTSEKSVSMGSDRPMGSERGSAGRSSRAEDSRQQQREGVVRIRLIKAEVRQVQNIVYCATCVSRIPRTKLFFNIQYHF